MVVGGGEVVVVGGGGEVVVVGGGEVVVVEGGVEVVGGGAELPLIVNIAQASIALPMGKSAMIR